MNLRELEKQSIAEKENLRVQIGDVLIDNGFDGKSGHCYEFNSAKLGFVVRVKLELINAIINYDYLENGEWKSDDCFEGDLTKLVPLEDVVRESEELVVNLLKGYRPELDNCLTCVN